MPHLIIKLEVAVLQSIIHVGVLFGNIAHSERDYEVVIDINLRAKMTSISLVDILKAREVVKKSRSVVRTPMLTNVQTRLGLEKGSVDINLKLETMQRSGICQQLHILFSC